MGPESCSRVPPRAGLVAPEPLAWPTVSLGLPGPHRAPDPPHTPFPPFCPGLSTLLGAKKPCPLTPECWPLLSAHEAALVTQVPRGWLWLEGKVVSNSFPSATSQSQRVRPVWRAGGEKPTGAGPRWPQGTALQCQHWTGEGEVSSDSSRLHSRYSIRRNSSPEGKNHRSQRTHRGVTLRPCPMRRAGGRAPGGPGCKATALPLSRVSLESRWSPGSQASLHSGLSSISFTYRAEFTAAPPQDARLEGNNHHWQTQTLTLFASSRAQPRGCFFCCAILLGVDEAQIPVNSDCFLP